MQKIIIVPDVHGRKFWKTVEGVTDTPVVFLGDYLDPYSHEGISEEDALENFQEILEYARTHPNVHLLIGNHDCGYMFDREVCNCRTLQDYHRARHMFLDNSGLFKLAYGVDNILLTHAGVDGRWISEITRRGYVDFEESMTTDETGKLYIYNLTRFVQDLNGLLTCSNGKIIKSLGMVSTSRGGWTQYGSCVWEDIQDFRSGCDLGVDQVCGHTMQLKKRSILGHWVWVGGDPKSIPDKRITCVDCQRMFYLDTDGGLYDYNSDKKVF